MNTRRNIARRLDEDIAREGVSPSGNRVPPLEKVANDYQASANPPAMTDGDIRDAFLQISQAIITQAQVVTTKAQAMTAKDTWEVVP